MSVGEGSVTTKRRRLSQEKGFAALDRLVERSGAVSRDTSRVAEAEVRPEILLVDIDFLHADPGQPRKAFGGIDELAQSIYRHGLLSALTIAPDRPTPLGHTYRVVAGERRLRALKKLVDTDGHERFRRVPCIVIRGERTEQMLASLAENLVREDLSALEEAEFTRALKQESGKSTAALATALGMAEGWVQQRLQIAEALSPEARDILIDWQRAAVGDQYAPDEMRVRGAPPFSFLRRLAFAPRDVQASAARVVLDKGYNAREADAYVREVAIVGASAGGKKRRGKRLVRQFHVRPPAEVVVTTQQRVIPVQTASGADSVVLDTVDVRALNIVHLVRYAERRGWMVDPDDFLQHLRAAAASDERKLAELVAIRTGAAPSQHTD